VVKRLWLINSLFLIAFLTSCTPTTERLINAIDEGNLEKVQRLIDRGVLLNDTQSSMQPLERAILRRQFDIYIELLSHGADPNYPMQNGMMPFVYLVGAAQYDYLIPLIEAGASFNFERNGDHIAFYLIEQNQFNVIEALLRFGLDKDIENDWDHTLLGAALSNPDVNALEVLLLLESGFELLGTDSRGRRAYDLMMSRRPNNLIIEILTKSNISLSQITDPWSQLIYDWEEDNREEGGRIFKV
jgi:ankyrin repeat protein